MLARWTILLDGIVDPFVGIPAELQLHDVPETDSNLR